MTALHTSIAAALIDRYRVEREFGRGGMATVFLAHDLKHDRDVAIKVLHPDLAAALGGERFLAEIRTTARLQHPHILPLLDSGDADGLLYYVMPLVTGETIRARLERETQLPVDDALRIAREVADALAYAHDHGVIHRDIKPENILLQDGHAVVADFGIALAVQSAAGPRLTQSGVSVGTPQYMSPEQAMGERTIDARSDIYALGAVLYEMLTGEPPVTGPTLQAIVARVMAEPARSVRAQRQSVPLRVDFAVSRALQKIPADRFSTAHEFAAALANPYAETASIGGGAQLSTPPTQRPFTLPLGVALALMSAVAIWLAFRPAPDKPRADATRFLVSVDHDGKRILGGQEDAKFGYPANVALALSPEGTALVFAASQFTSGALQESNLYLRKMSDERVEVLPGTENASAPFFSPDGAWIGFFAGSSLRRAPIAGGPVQTIVPNIGSDPSYVARGATWGDDGSIIFAAARGLYRVPSSGGDAALIAPLDTALHTFTRYDRPQMLPGSRVVLFHGQRSADSRQAEILALDLGSKRVTSVLADGMNPLYVAGGRLLFMRRGKLLAVGFDADHVKPSGQAVVVLENVMQAVAMPNTIWETGAAQIAVSASGHLAYVAGGIHPERRRTIVRVSLDGRAKALPLDWREYLSVRVSPSGDRLLLHARTNADSRATSVYIHDLARGITTRLNTGGFSNVRPMWSPDGRAVAYASDRESGIENIYTLPTDGSGEPRRLAPSNLTQMMSSWSSQGAIAYLQAGDIWILAPGGTPATFFKSSATEAFPTFSPDGRWLAYVSDATGRQEVYVRPYPGPGTATQISGDGGEAPAWSPNGRRLYFAVRQGASLTTMMAVDVVADGPFRAGRPARLMDWRGLASMPVRAYDLFPDGSFVTVVDSGAINAGRMTAGTPEHLRFGATEVHVVLDFLDELRVRLAK